METKEGEKDVFKLARARWRSYFSKLFNGEGSAHLERGYQEGHQNDRFCSRISKEEVRKVLGKMKAGKAIGLDLIPIEIWKCLGEKGLEWLVEFFNVIFRTAKMPSKWRTGTIISVYKNEGNIQDCNNYRVVKLLSYTMKLREKMIERWLRKDISISENQCDFIPGRSTTEAIHFIRRLTELYKVRKKDLHMVFIDLKKAYDRIPREVL